MSLHFELTSIKKDLAYNDIELDSWSKILERTSRDCKHRYLAIKSSIEGDVIRVFDNRETLKNAPGYRLMSMQEICTLSQKILGEKEKRDGKLDKSAVFDIQQKIEKMTISKSSKLNATSTKVKYVALGLLLFVLTVATLGLAYIHCVGPYFKQLSKKIDEGKKDVDAVQKILSSIGISKPKEKNRWKEVKSARLPSIDEEFSRLKNHPRIGLSLDKVEKSLELSSKKQVAFAHSLEVYNEFGKDYFVFNHGQGLAMMIINIFNKELKKREPSYKKEFSEFHLLRHEVHLRHLEESQSPEWYQKKIGTIGAKKKDSDYRNELISVDCHLENTTTAESALYYFKFNSNVGTREAPFVQDVLTPILQDQFPLNIDVQNETLAQLRNLIKVYSKTKHDGNLYSICVPKTKIKEMGFFCGPYGRKLDRSYSTEDLELIQKGHLPKTETVPQFRLLTKKLTKEEGVKIFLSSTLNKTEKEILKKEVREIIETAFRSFPSI